MKKTLCFLSGLLLAASVLLCAVLLPALSTSRFEKALLSTVDQQALGMSESDLSAFAEETMRYLKHQKMNWQPEVPFEVPESFRAHMAEVKGWVTAAPWVIGCGILIGLCFLGIGKWQRRPALFGVCALLVLIVCVLVWAAVDFHSFWMVLHRLFIPNGIFAYNEPVMQLFPLSLFFRYVVPVAVSALAHLAVLVTAGWLFLRKM